MSNRESKRKLVFGLISLVAAVGIIVSVGYAYFSDVITGNGSATAGTLDISGTPTIKQNGVVVAGGNITNLNPGDLITSDIGTITNNGTKSAWIRSVLKFTVLSSTDNTASGAAANSVPGNLANYLWVCTGGETQAQLIGYSNMAGGFAANKPADCAQANTTDVFGAKTTYTAPGDVISGSVEADGDGATWTATAAPAVYFDAAATNAAQNGNAAFNILIQSLQYRNNNTSPTEAQWSTVVTTPFAL